MWWNYPNKRNVGYGKKISKITSNYEISKRLDNQRVKFKLFNNIGRYFANHVSEFLSFSILLNMITALIKFYFGITIPSYLFGFNAGYYFVLCVARILLLIKLRRINTNSKLSEQEKIKLEVHVYGNIGIFTILLGVMYFVSSLQLYYTNENVVYSGYLVYYVALVAFTKLIMAIHGKIIHKRFHKPIMAALKQISFSDALVSIVVTECTLLVMKGNTQANLWSSYSGMMVSGVIFFQGIMMLMKVRNY